MSHSPEPWKVTEVEVCYPGGGRVNLCWIVDSSGRFVAETEYCDRPEELARANAHRIVACVNFCQQIPTETLEKLLEIRVGARTVLEWLKRLEHGMQTVEENATYDVCWQCSTLRPDHADDCLLGKTVASI